MRKKQLVALFLCTLVIWTVGNGLTPLLPVYAIRLGAEPALVGSYLSFILIALALGTLTAGWLSDKFQRRKMLLIVSDVLSTPAIWLMGRATTIWHLAVLTAIVWFMGGMKHTLLRTLTGLFADEAERGKVFGILALTGPLGALIGGTMTGPIVDRWGYSTLFVVLALFWSLSPFIVLFLEDKVVIRAQRGETAATEEAPRLGGNVFLLFLASIVVGMVVFIGKMGRSLAMDELGFSATAISSTVAISGVIALPLPPLIGWLSDRVGRKQCLTLCYLAGTMGLLILAMSASLWHFWIAIVLLRILASVNRAVGSALTTDLVPQALLGRGMSLFIATAWVGGIIGSFGTGYAVQHLGILSTFILGGLLSPLAIILLIPIRQARREEVSE